MRTHHTKKTVSLRNSIFCRMLKNSFISLQNRTLPPLFLECIMNVSLAWIFEHINADWKKLDVAEIIARFNRTTAEIEGFEEISFDADNYALAEVVSIGDTIEITCAEWKLQTTLPTRSDAKKGDLFIICKNNTKISWASLVQWGCPKDGLLPAMHVAPKECAGGWKKHIQAKDVILDVDNKSITHRPDMWGHRGFAREIAAMFDLKLKPLKDFVFDIKINNHKTAAKSSKSQPIAIAINDARCTRFAGCYMTNVQHVGCLPWMAYRLAITQNRAINAIVDATNYAMLDVGHPMHAFDAHNIEKKQIAVRAAKKNEKLVLLDDQELSLNAHDIVIADGTKALSLAGIMGGKHSGISNKTSDLFLEAAWFDATTIRKTAAHYKLRTEASSRFEKTLDPNGNSAVLQRFVQLLKKANITFDSCSAIDSVGKQAPSQIIEISHALLEQSIGAPLTTKQITSICTKLSFDLKHKKHKDGVIYAIEVPSFRSTKDVRIKQDIIEEIARFVGYDNITPELPRMQLQPKDLDAVNRVRLIKSVCAQSMNMQETYGYAFFDESFVQTLDWQPENTISVQSPVSHNWKQLVTTLMPNMFKVVATNAADHDALRFFEWARVWHKKPKVVESRRLAGIFFDKKNEIDFYDGKRQLNSLFDALDCDVQWQQVADPQVPWYAPYRTAHIVHKKQIVGAAGIIEPFFLKDITDGHAFGFELDGDFVLNFKAAKKKFVPLPKYQDVHRDVTVLVPNKMTVAALQQTIHDAHKQVESVSLHDFFTKPEWNDQKALTFRFVLRDHEKTMTKQQADAMCQTIHDALKRAGAEIR